MEHVDRLIQDGKIDCFTLRGREYLSLPEYFLRRNYCGPVGYDDGTSARPTHCPADGD